MCGVAGIETKGEVPEEEPDNTDSGDPGVRSQEEHTRLGVTQGDCSQPHQGCLGSSLSLIGGRCQGGEVSLAKRSGAAVPMTQWYHFIETENLLLPMYLLSKLSSGKFAGV